MEKPEKLHKLYGTILHGISEDQRHQSLVLMRWICFALRPLSLPQVREIVVLEASPQVTSLTECHETYECASVETDADMKVRIIDLSGGLAEVKKHDDEEVIQLLGDTAPGHIVGYSHLHLSSLCARYLSMDEVLSIDLEYSSCGYPSIDDARTIRTELIQSFPLIEYAMCFWVEHASKAEKYEVPQKDLLQACLLLHSSWIRMEYQWTRLYKILVSLYPSFPALGMTISHEMTRYGLHNILSMFVDAKADEIELQDQLGRTPLYFAVQYGKVEVVKLLLGHNADTSLKDDNGRTLLSFAARIGEVEVVKLLLAHTSSHTSPEVQAAVALLERHSHRS